MGGSFSLREKLILGFLTLLLAAGAAWHYFQPQQKLERVDLAGPPAPAEPAEPEKEMITIHLVGAVNNPGVYRLPEGSRVYEALELAGGVTGEADLEMVNLARPLFDGEQLTIPRPGEAQPPGETKININRATEEELMSLPGIGATRAGKIIEHRDKYGYFTGITQIMEVSGIGEGIFQDIKDLITVY